MVYYGIKLQKNTFLGEQNWVDAYVDLMIYLLNFYVSEILFML